MKKVQIQHVEEISRRLQDQVSNMMARTTDAKERDALQVSAARRQQMVEEIKKAPFLGRVVLKLDPGYKFTGTDWDIGLEDGDSLLVGQQPNVISIMGEVFSPTNVVFNREASTVGKCLSYAGGVTEYGDEGNVFYIQPDGSVITPKTTWFFRSTDVEPGGSIIVPPKAPKKDYLDALTKITQIIYQVAISVGVAKTLF